MSLLDAGQLLTSDVRFPSTGSQAAQKMYAWSVVIDIFHGHAHGIATSIRDMVLKVGPAMEAIATTSAENPAVGMDLCCRIMFDAQQDYFEWMQIIGSGGVCVIPSFGNLTSKVLSYRASSLSNLPAPWYLMIKAGAPQVRSRTEAQAPISVREEAGAVPRFNTFADEQLLARFSDSRFNTIKELLDAFNGDEPKYNGKPVCLTWALKGSCGRRCKRREAHVRYPPAVNNKISQLLTDAGVPPTGE